MKRSDELLPSRRSTRPAGRRTCYSARDPDPGSPDRTFLDRLSVSGSVTDAPGFCPGTIAGRRRQHIRTMGGPGQWHPFPPRAGVIGRAHARTTLVPKYQVQAGTIGGASIRSWVRSRTMSPRSLVAVLAAVMFLSAACAPTPAVSFDPTGACTSDGSAPGAYPDLEALVPATYRDERPGTLDSGRHCSGPALGTLASAGIAEIRFAGGHLVVRGGAGCGARGLRGARPDRRRPGRPSTPRAHGRRTGPRS